MVWWGVPLSVIAAAAMMWGFKSGSFTSIGASLPLWFKWTLVVLTFFASLLLWAVCFMLVRCLETGEPIQDDTGHIDDYDELKEDIVYDWFNTNPVYVLKCSYCPEKINDVDIDRRMSYGPYEEYTSKSVGKTQEIVDKYYEVGMDYLFLG